MRVTDATPVGKLLLHLESAVVCAPPGSHCVLPCFAIWLLAAVTMCSALNPNFFWSCFKGAEAPKLSIPMLCPSEPVYLLHPKSEACSTETRARTFGGKTYSR